MSGATVKPPADRLYGRVKGKKLRPRQEWLLKEFLPLVSYGPAPFAVTPRETWAEVGFGGGEHAHSLAAANPEINFIAAEVFEAGICSLLAKLAPHNPTWPGLTGPSTPSLTGDGSRAEAWMAGSSPAMTDYGNGSITPPPNLRLFTDDARPLIRSLPDNALTKLFLMFPDPWPKARHAKRRFVHPAMVPEVARVLAPGGEWRIASDDPTYQAWTDGVLAAQGLFTVSRTTTRPEGWPSTRYEGKAILAGRIPVYWSALRKSAT